jgi:NAD(P)-dependent dehydrogenase (short-subunit alcohol dehydrogenase family)
VNNKTILITGATSGIGKAAAFLLAETGAELILLGRNANKGEKICNQIKLKTSNNKVNFFKADFFLMSEVKAAAEKINNKYELIDILINNAGGRFLEHKVSEEGIEQSLAVNHLSHFLLTDILINKLKRSPSSRIINVSSSTHYGGKGVIKNINSSKDYDGKQQYSDSKLANVLFTYKLAEKLSASKVTVNTMDPGGVATNFARNNGFVNWMKHRVYYLMKKELLTPAQGAETVIYLAASPEVDKVTGKYFYKKKEKRSSELSYNNDLQKQLWDFSNELLLKIR